MLAVNGKGSKSHNYFLFINLQASGVEVLEVIDNDAAVSVILSLSFFARDFFEFYASSAFADRY